MSLATPLTSAQKSDIVDLLQRGIDKKAIANTVGATAGQVAAIAAHVTMRTYEKPQSIAAHKTAPIAAADSDVIGDTAVVELEPENESIEGEPALASATDQPNVGAHSEGLIYIGTEVDTQAPVYWTPTPERGTTNPHLLIVGESGSGKTYTTQCLCTEFAAIGLPTIIFDFGQGFTLDTAPSEFLERAHPIELAAGRAGININPLQIFPTDIHGPLNVAQRIADTFARVYSERQSSDSAHTSPAWRLSVKRRPSRGEATGASPRARWSEAIRVSTSPPSSKRPKVQTVRWRGLPSSLRNDSTSWA